MQTQPLKYRSPQLLRACRGLNARQKGLPTLLDHMHACAASWTL